MSEFVSLLARILHTRVASSCWSPTFIVLDALGDEGPPDLS